MLLLFHTACCFIRHSTNLFLSNRQFTFMFVAKWLCSVTIVNRNGPYFFSIVKERAALYFGPEIDTNKHQMSFWKQRKQHIEPW